MLSPEGLLLSSATIAQAIEGMGKSVKRLAVTPDNRIVAGGTHLGPGGIGQFVQRFNADLSVDIGFGKSGDGTVIVPGVVQLLGLSVLLDNSLVLTYANQMVTVSSAGIVGMSPVTGLRQIASAFPVAVPHQGFDIGLR